MAEVIVYRGFLKSRSEVQSERIRKRIDAMLKTIEATPGVGSALVADSIRLAFGNNIRKALVLPYEIIYEYDPPSDTVYIYALLYCHSVL